MTGHSFFLTVKELSPTEGNLRFSKILTVWIVFSLKELIVLQNIGYMIDYVLLGIRNFMNMLCNVDPFIAMSLQS